MSLEPVFEIGNHVTPDPFDKTLCMFCQKAVVSQKLGRPKKDNADDFNDFIKTCRDHAKYKTEKYTMLHNEISDKTNEQLKTEKYCYHSQCRQKFNRDKVYISRKRKAEEVKEQEIRTKQMCPTRVLRTEAGQFDYTKCLFCQEDNATADLHDITQDSRDLELKEAFEDSPVALQKFKIRSLSAFDAMAGELKYHLDCWNNNIQRRLPEKPSTSSSTSMSNIRGSKRVSSLHGISDDPHSDTSFTRRTEQVGDKHACNDVDTNIQEVVEEELQDNQVLEVWNSDGQDESKKLRRSIRQMQSEKTSTQSSTDTMIIGLSESMSLQDISSDESDSDTSFTCHTVQTVGKDAYLDVDTSIQDLVVAELISGVELALHDGQVLTVRNVVEVYQSRMKELGQIDNTSYRTLRKMIVRRLRQQIPEVSFEESFPNQSQRITTKDMEKLIMRLAEEKCKTDDVILLKRAANILRRTTLKFMKDNPVNFSGSIESEYDKCPDILRTFLKWLVGGDRPLNGVIDENINIVSRTLSFDVMYNMKTKRQADYKPKHSNQVTSRHTYTPLHQIGMGLSLRHMDRNNNVIRLISLFGYSIPDRQCLRWGTIIANSIIDLMLANDNVYIPPNLVKDVVPMFHIDNIDWQEDTPDGKNTTHMLMICIMQRRICKPIPLSLKLNAKTASLTLTENSFDELIPCNKPSKTKFTRTSGCSAFSISQISDNNRGIWRCWLTVRCFERLFLRENINAWCLDQASQQQLDEDQNMQRYAKKFSEAFAELVLPSFGATNSLVSNTDTTITNIFTTPLVPGPASCWSAMLTSLMRVKNITAWTCGDTKKTIVSLDLDLYEKIYLLVNTSKNLKNRYVLCLGELHAVFAHLRAIGRFIDGLGVSDAWIQAGWYDSEALVRQVLDCGNMKRATAAHEATVIAITSVILRALLIQCSDEVDDKLLEIKTTIQEAAQSIQSKKDEKFRASWKLLQNLLCNTTLEINLDEFLKGKENNKLLQIFVMYINKVERLFTFIEASRTRDWLLHLSAGQELMEDFVSMDRIKYRRMWAVYLADMAKLENDDPDIWNSFMEGNFSCQKTDIQGTAIGRDHAGEQVNKVLKTRGGLTGITRNENSRTRHFLLAPVLQSISDEMLKLGGADSTKPKKHHELNNSYTRRQNRSVSSLIDVFTKQGLDFESDDQEFRNIVTGQMFSDEIYTDMMNSEKTGRAGYEKFVVDRLQPESKTGIFATLTKSNVKTCKSANKSQKMNVNDRVVELQYNCNLFARCAILKGKRDIDMKVVVGDYELMTVPRSLMTSDGKLIPGHTGKSNLTHEVINECGVGLIETVDVDCQTCVVIDAMSVVNTIVPKPTWVETGNDLAKEFLRRIDDRSENAETVAIAFDTYRKASLKYTTRDGRKAKGKLKKAPRTFQINGTINIKKVSMSEILETNETKRSLTKFLMEKSIEHMQKRNVRYVIAGNDATYSSFQDPISNNHEEADTLMINILCILQPINRKVVVHSVDTDVFVLLVRHHDKIACETLYMNLVGGFVNITAISQSLSQTVSTALLSLHALTGCDTTGKFAGIGKGTWVKRFLLSKHKENFIVAMSVLENGVSDEILSEFANFVCGVYRHPRITQNLPDAMYDLSSTRYHLFRKSAAEGEKLPPSAGAFLMHVERGYIQNYIWGNAHLSIIDEIDYSEHGFEFRDDLYIPIPSKEPIAPVAVIEMVSCKSCKLCNTARCPCRQTDPPQPCTDFCGCGENCENTDAPMPQNVMNDDEEEDVHDDDAGEDRDD